MANLSLPTDIPPPHAPPIRKRDLYTDTSVFDELDRDVIKVRAKCARVESDCVVCAVYTST